MEKHSFLPVLFAGVASCCSCNSGLTAQKPNIVIFLADDMGWGDIAPNGNRFVETPALSGLRKQSLSFDRFYVCPLSAPTRAEMLTGRYFLRTGVSSVTRGFENMRTDEVTIAEVLRDNGYTTGCFGKWHNGGYFLQHPNRQGFDQFVGFCVGHLGYYFDSWFLHNDEDVRSQGYTTDYFTDRALDFISGNRDHPFLCYIPYNVPHSPFQVPADYFNKYKVKDLDSTLSSVYGMVENMDHNIERVLQHIDDLKITDNTIVIFFSDNGPNTDRFNGGMKGRKGSVDEGGVRVPFYIRWPGRIKPGTTDQLAQDIDIMPTLLSLCGIIYNPVKTLDGANLSGVIQKTEQTFDRYIYSRQGNQVLKNCNSSVRNDRFRLVLTRTDTLLYDLQNDPGQKNDISGTEIPTRTLLLDLLQKHNDELISGYEPVTTVEAGFPEEKKFTLPVQDASLSGKIRFSSIHPNQSHTENWIHENDSIYWKLNINNSASYEVWMQYGCTAGNTGSTMALYSGLDTVYFQIDKPFNSEILPERDYVKRTESVERTWSWMSIGHVNLSKGPGTVTLKLLEKKNEEAGLVKAIRFTKL